VEYKKLIIIINNKRMKIEQFKSLSDGYRVVLLIHRSKEGGFNNKKLRHLKKTITRNSEEFEKVVNEFEMIKNNDERSLRVYASINDRNLDKAIRLFKQRQLDIEYGGNKDRFYTDLRSIFISCLMKKEAKNNSNFLFDLDEIDERSLITTRKLLKNNTNILLEYKTKNGVHIITEPFNYPKVLNEHLIKSLNVDGLMLLSFD